MAIFTETHDSEIQLAPSSADDFQRIAHGSGEKERGIGAKKRSSYHRLDVGVACVEKRPAYLHWLIPVTAKAKMWTAAHALSFILFVTSLRRITIRLPASALFRVVDVTELIPNVPARAVF